MKKLTRMMGFVSTTDMDRARSFYHGTLGFAELSEDDYGVTFDANGLKIRVAKARTFTPAQGTVLGWEVDDINEAVTELTKQGVQFEQFNLAFMKQDENGVWNAPGGDQVAWFKDPDGNMLSISRHAH